jgi:hypothetical protein
MYRMELDFVIWFVPPMEDRGDGIRFTRTIEMPFVPAKRISLHSSKWENIEGEPFGYRLKEIIWDFDHECFLAETHTSATGVPIAMIPHEIANLIECGWRFGSYKDGYSIGSKRTRKRKKELPRLRIKKWDWDEAEKWEATRDGRPAEFKTVLQAVIRTMLELRNHRAVAYAMQHTGTFFGIEDDIHAKPKSPGEEKFLAAMRDFGGWSYDKQWDWCQLAQARLPRLIDVVEAMK